MRGTTREGDVVMSDNDKARKFGKFMDVLIIIGLAALIVALILEHQGCAQ